MENSTIGNAFNKWHMSNSAPFFLPTCQIMIYILDTPKGETIPVLIVDILNGCNLFNHKVVIANIVDDDLLGIYFMQKRKCKLDIQGSNP